jgi:hypothetical protein
MSHRLDVNARLVGVGSCDYVLLYNVVLIVGQGSCRMFLCLVLLCIVIDYCLCKATVCRGCKVTFCASLYHVSAIAYCRMGECMLDSLFSCLCLTV